MFQTQWSTSEELGLSFPHSVTCSHFPCWFPSCRNTLFLSFRLLSPPTTAFGFHLRAFICRYVSFPSTLIRTIYLLAICLYQFTLKSSGYTISSPFVVHCPANCFAPAITIRCKCSQNSIPRPSAILSRNPALFHFPSPFLFSLAVFLLTSLLRHCSIGCSFPFDLLSLPLPLPPYL